MPMRSLLLLAFMVPLAGADQASAQGRQPQRSDVDRSERVIRTPDNSNVPADLYPRERRDFQITVDPYMHRRGVDLDPNRPPRQRRAGDR